MIGLNSNGNLVRPGKKGEPMIVIDPVFTEQKFDKSVPRPESVYITTYTGRHYHIFDPQTEDFSILDIAHSLAQKPRFSGSMRQPISVAQHCMLVSHLCPQAPLGGLIHDVIEAYLGDMARGLKHSGAMNTFIEIEYLGLIAFCKAFGIPDPWNWMHLVKPADDIAAVIEARAQMPAGTVEGWGKPWTEVSAEKELDRADVPNYIRYALDRPFSAQEAENVWLGRFRTLTAGRC